MGSRQAHRTGLKYGAMTKPAPFDWLESRRNADYDKGQKARRETMYRLELEERAALLHRLGHGKERARARLGANLDWDFPPGARPLDAAALDAIVDRVFGRPTAKRAAPPVKGGAK